MQYTPADYVALESLLSNRWTKKEMKSVAKEMKAKAKEVDEALKGLILDDDPGYLEALEEKRREYLSDWKDEQPEDE